MKTLLWIVLGIIIIYLALAVGVAGMSANEALVSMFQAGVQVASGR